MKMTLPKTISFVVALGLGCIAAAEREETTPTSHRYVSNVSEAAIDDLTDDGFRLHDIEVVDTSPLRYAGSFVRNSGPHGKAWWWTANKTGAQLIDYYTQRDARIIDLEMYMVSGQRRYAATMVRKTGQDDVQWWWFDDKTWNEVSQLISTRGARVTDLDVQVVGNQRRYSGVMVKNTGEHYRQTWTFSNISLGQMQQQLTDRDMRLIDVERISNNRYAGVMQKKDGEVWTHGQDRTWEELEFAVDQFGSRVIDIERYTVGNQVRFSFVLLNNSNALETRIGQFLRSRTNGARGFMLKEVGGSTRGGLMEDFRFYPASTIKALEHFYWTWRIDLFGQSPNTAVPLYNDHWNDTHPLNGSTISSWTTLRNSMRQSMLVSSNQNANALMDFAGGGNGVIGRNVMNNFAHNVLGLSDDFALNHKMGIGGQNSNDPNIATCRQFLKLYEKAVDGSVLNVDGQDFFRLNMLNQGANPTTGGFAQNVISEEGAFLGKSPATRAAFRSQVRCMWKGGNVSKHAASAGWIRLPYRNGDRIFYKEFVVAAFVHDASVINLSMSFDALPEIIREEVRAALSTWP